MEQDNERKHFDWQYIEECVLKGEDNTHKRIRKPWKWRAQDLRYVTPTVHNKNCAISSDNEYGFFVGISLWNCMKYQSWCKTILRTFAFFKYIFQSHIFQISNYYWELYDSKMTDLLDLWYIFNFWCITRFPLLSVSLNTLLNHSWWRN